MSTCYVDIERRRNGGSGANGETGGKPGQYVYIYYEVYYEVYVDVEREKNE